MKNFSKLLLSHLENNPNKKCLYIIQPNLPDTPITYRELMKNSACYAKRYQSLDIQPGEVIVLILQHENKFSELHPAGGCVRAARQS